MTGRKSWPTGSVTNSAVAIHDTNASRPMPRITCGERETDRGREGGREGVEWGGIEREGE